MTAATTQCVATRKGGERCKSTLGLSPDGLCFFHNPAQAHVVAAARSAGGIAGGVAKRARRERMEAMIPDDVPDAPKNLEDAVKYFAWITHAVTSGRLDARSAHEAAYALNGFKAAAEKRDLEREIKKLRAELASARTQQGTR